MAKWIGTINVGYGDTHVTIEADTEEDAKNILYDYWLQECENQCERSLRPWSEQLEKDFEPDPLN